MKQAKDKVWEIAIQLANPEMDRADREIMYKNMLAIVRDAQRGKKPPRVTPDTFLAFWTLYPLKVAKQPAEKAYMTALKATDHETIIKGVNWYIANKDEKLSWAHAASWLNARRWEDGQLEVNHAAPMDISEWPEWKKQIAKALNPVIVNTWFKDGFYTHGGYGAQITLPKAQYQWVKDRYKIDLQNIFGDIEIYQK